MYLADFAYRDKSICGIVYGEQCKSNSLITTCFHSVHANCYIEMGKEEFVFACPVCEKKGHCLLPATLRDQGLNRMCENVLNVSMMIVHYVYG